LNILFYLSFGVFAAASGLKDKETKKVETKLLNSKSFSSPCKRNEVWLFFIERLDRFRLTRRLKQKIVKIWVEGSPKIGASFRGLSF
jgi:hypothetical protein